MKYVCALVVVKDIKRSRFFYEEILGQKVSVDAGENVSYKGGFAIQQKDHFRSLINSLPVKEAANNFELYFEDDDLEILLQKLKSNDIEFIHEVREQPWKQRVVRFYDYDHNSIEIGESMEYVAYRLSLENYSIEDICRITYIPEHIVKNAIAKYSG